MFDSLYSPKSLHQLISEDFDYYIQYIVNNIVDIVEHDLIEKNHGYKRILEKTYECPVLFRKCADGFIDVYFWDNSIYGSFLVGIKIVEITEKMNNQWMPPRVTCEREFDFEIRDKTPYNIEHKIFCEKIALLRKILVFLPTTIYSELKLDADYSKTDNEFNS